MIRIDVYALMFNRWKHRYGILHYLSSLKRLPQLLRQDWKDFAMAEINGNPYEYLREEIK